MEHALFALAKDPDHMSSVKSFLPWQNIVYARAIQGADSTGQIQPDTTQFLTVRVKSSVMGNTQTPATCLIESQFKPKLSTFVYKYLMSLTKPDSSITIIGNASHIQLGTSSDVSKIWQTANLYTNWSTNLGSEPASPPLPPRISAVPIPDLTPFMPGSLAWSSALGPTRPGNSGNWTLDAGPS